MASEIGKKDINAFLAVHQQNLDLLPNKELQQKALTAAKDLVAQETSGKQIRESDIWSAAHRADLEQNPKVGSVLFFALITVKYPDLAERSLKDVEGGLGRQFAALFGAKGPGDFEPAPELVNELKQFITPTKTTGEGLEAFFSFFPLLTEATVRADAKSVSIEATDSVLVLPTENGKLQTPYIQQKTADGLGPKQPLDLKGISSSALEKLSSKIRNARIAEDVTGVADQLRQLYLAERTALSERAHENLPEFRAILDRFFDEVLGLVRFPGEGTVGYWPDLGSLFDANWFGRRYRMHQLLPESTPGKQ